MSKETSLMIETVIEMIWVIVSENSHQGFLPAPPCLTILAPKMICDRSTYLNWYSNFRRLPCEPLFQREATAL